MKRDLSFRYGAKAASMKSWRHIVLHTGAAAAFLFLLQRYGLNASLESTLLWALTFGGCGAGLASTQVNR
jgi:hypothetical protein